MPRVVIYTKPTDYERLLVTYGTKSAARFALESRGTSFVEKLEIHEVEHSARRLVESRIPAEYQRTRITSLEQLTHFPFLESDIIVTVGGNGLFANIARFVSDQPIITINADPHRNERLLALHDAASFEGLLTSVTSGTAKYDRIPLALAETDDRRQLYAANDFFVGRGDQGTAAYTVRFGGAEEHHLSSGVVLTTGIGRTGWFRSILTSARRLSGQYTLMIDDGPNRTDTSLRFVVREPMPLNNASLFYGTVNGSERIEFVSDMPEGGVITCDGLLREPLIFETGTRVTITPAARFVNLVVSA